MIKVADFANAVGVPVEEITGSRRFAHVVLARQLYWKLLRDHYGCTYQRAGDLTGRKHCTVLAGVNRVNGLLAQKDWLATEMWKKVVKLKR